MLATAAANSIVATRITRRGPYLSSIGPIIGEQTAKNSVLTETAADTCVRPQLNSAASGLMKTRMLARNVGEMLNASPMMQGRRRTGAYPMVQPLLARVAPGSVLPHTVSIRFGADDDSHEAKSAAYTTDVQTNTAHASVPDPRGCHP